MHACLVSNSSSSGLVSNSLSSGTGSPWSPASLSCRGSGLPCLARCSRSLPSYPQVMLSIWQTGKDVLQFCQGHTITNLLIHVLYLTYTWYIPYLFNSWWDMPWICWTQSLVYLLYIVYTRQILLFLSMYLVFPWNISLRKTVTWFIAVLRTH